VTCTTAGAVVAAAAQTLTLVAGAVTTGVPQAAATFQVSTSTDTELAVAASTEQLGGQLSAGVGLAFASAGDRVPGTVNSGNVTLGFTVATPIPVGGSIVFLFPYLYFSFFNSSQFISVINNGFVLNVQCFLKSGSAGSTFDTLLCIPVLAAGCSDCPASTFVSYISYSSYVLISFTAPSPGNYRFMFSSAAYMGLAASYYGSACNSSTYRHWTLECPAIASVPYGSAAEWNLANSAGRFGVNLAGFIKAPVRGRYRIYLRTLTGRGSGDLWIGNSRIIASEGSQEGHFTFESSLLFDFQMSYFKLNGSDTTMQLEWESIKMFRQQVPNVLLFSAINLDSLNSNSLISIVS
jgi:hypothetical protein